MPPQQATSTAAGAVRNDPRETSSPSLGTARLLLLYAHKAARALIGACDRSRAARRPSGGQTTDAEQDLLRAAVVFSSAGLDATLKQIVKDTLPEIIERNPKTRKQLAAYTSRQLRKTKEKESATVAIDADFLGAILAGDSPRAALTEKFAGHLTADSLQSAEQVQKIASELGIGFESLDVASKDLKETFDVRNRIVHEMDLDVESQDVVLTRGRS